MTSPFNLCRLASDLGRPFWVVMSPEFALTADINRDWNYMPHCAELTTSTGHSAGLYPTGHGVRGPREACAG